MHLHALGRWASNYVDLKCMQRCIHLHTLEAIFVLHTRALHTLRRLFHREKALINYRTRRPSHEAARTLYPDDVKLAVHRELAERLKQADAVIQDLAQIAARLGSPEHRAVQAARRAYKNFFTL